MPGNILNADTGFPRFQEGQSNSDKINVIMNYLYMLLEQLRYSMGNLDESNFNPQGLEQLAKVITDPVYVELQNEDGKITQVSATADGITARLNNFGVKPFDATATYCVGACVSKDGKFYYCIEDITTPGPWDATKWQETNDVTAEAQLTATNQNVSTKISGTQAQSLINQTVESITVQVVDTTAGTVSTIGLYSGGNIVMEAEDIRVAGFVTFEELNAAPGSGRTTIDGGWLSTELLTGNLIQAANIEATYIDGVYIYGSHGLYGPRVITRKYLSGSSSAYHKRFQETKIDNGEIRFGIIDRGQWNDAFKDGNGNISDGINAKTGLTETNTIDSSSYGYEIKEDYGGIYADYGNHRLYISTEGTDHKRLKLESGYNMSLTANFSTSPPPDNPSESTTYGGLYGGRLYIGTEAQEVEGYNYGQEIRIGSPYGHAVIIAHDDVNGNQTRPSVQNAYEFRTDGIYYNGTKVLSV